MKKIYLIIMMLSGVLYGQTNINLEIKHTLNGINQVMNSVSTSNLNEDFKITRLQYYITRISIIHNGNQATAIHDSVVALINVNNELTSTIPLGAHAITSIEGVKFHIGVYSPVNNEDPQQWPSTHPLAPQNPSMHWGWASGYRFLAFEGLAGNNFSQLWQFHGLGNNNYFEIAEVLSPSVLVNGVETIRVEANYVMGIKDISVSQGLISHGETGAALSVLENFRDYVFKPATSLTVEENELNYSLKVGPNPCLNNEAKLFFDKELAGQTLKVYNVSGQLVNTVLLDNSGSSVLNFENKGIYFVKVGHQSLKIINL